MHKISWTFVVLLSLTLNGLAQSDVSKSRWKSKEIIIDGNDHDWTLPLNFYDDKSGLLFAICNDQRNVYLAFTVNDEMKMRKLMSAGWSVELSSKEKNKKFSASLAFPAIKMAGPGKRPGSEFEKKAPGNPVIEAYKSQLKAVETKGFLSNPATLPLNNHQGIDIAVGADSMKRIVYEIAIPLKELMVENIVQLNELITLNVSVNAMTRPSGGSERGNRSNSDGGMQESEMSGMGGGMQGGGMGGMNGSRGGMGGMGGGRGGMGGMGGEMSRGGNGSFDRSGLFEKVTFKQKFTLTKE